MSTVLEAAGRLIKQVDISHPRVREELRSADARGRDRVEALKHRADQLIRARRKAAQQKAA